MLMRSTYLHVVLVPLLAIGLFAGCGDDDDEATTDGTSVVDSTTDVPSVVDSTTTTVDEPDSDTTTSTPGESTTATPSIDTSSTAPDFGNPDCDPLNEGACAMPWPSNLYLEEDASRGTGYTLSFGETTLPANNASRVISPAPYRRMDGYSLGSPLLVQFLDLSTDNLPSQTDKAASLAADSPIVWLKVNDDGTTERVPFWAELDSRGGGRSVRSLIVRPAVILEEGTRYVVGMRDLETREGENIEPSEAFARLRDGDTENVPALETRQARFDEIFDILDDEGVVRDDLIIAWDFVTASSDGLHGNMIHMRDEALDEFPEGVDFRVNTVERFARPGSGDTDPAGSPLPENENYALRIVGEFDAPHFLVPEEVASDTGWVFNYGDDGRPEFVRDDQGEIELRTGDIWIQVPHSALDGNEQGLVMYGHGLNGTGSQTFSGFNGDIGEKNDLIFFGINMIGMSSEDVDGILRIVGNFDLFPWLADRLHQGVMEHVLVARGMQHFVEARLADVLSDPEYFAAEEDFSISVNDELYWSGISQGGIFGPTVVAVSPDITYGHMGVPGNNYSTLLHRSSNFTPFLALLNSNYADRVDRLLLLSVVQLLWDGADPISYLHKVHDDPFDEVEPGAILLAPAKGDYQVEVFTNEFAARSDHMSYALMENYDRERDPWGIDQTPYPHTGSGVVLWDFSNPWPEPDLNEPPSDAFGDPHGLPRNLEIHQDQMVHFFRNDGEIIDVCSDLEDGPTCYLPRSAD